MCLQVSVYEKSNKFTRTLLKSKVDVPRKGRNAITVTHNDRVLNKTPTKLLFVAALLLSIKLKEAAHVQCFIATLADLPEKPLAKSSRTISYLVNIPNT